MPLRAPRPGKYVYARESGGATKERTEEYEQTQKGDDYVVMFREFQFADVSLLNVEAWADSGVFWIQTRVPGVTSDFCKWPADNRPKVLPGDLSVPQTLKVQSTCTVRVGEQMTVSGTVEVKGRGATSETAAVETKLTVSYRGPARNISREADWVSDFSAREGLVISTTGSYSGTGTSRTEFRDRLRR
jgi:hypothetical protein